VKSPLTYLGHSIFEQNGADPVKNKKKKAFIGMVVEGVHGLASVLSIVNTV
jgi:hypothetical protein